MSVTHRAQAIAKHGDNTGDVAQGANNSRLWYMARPDSMPEQACPTAQDDSEPQERNVHFASTIQQIKGGKSSALVVHLPFGAGEASGAHGMLQKLSYATDHQILDTNEECDGASSED